MTHASNPAASLKMTKRRWRMRGGLAALGVVASMGAAGAIYTSWANELPPPEPEAVSLPNPNGFDACWKAAARLQLTTEMSAASAPDDLVPLRAFVKKHHAACDELRRALRLPYRTPPDRNWNPNYDYLPAYRQAARSLQGEARLARLEGRPDEGIQSALDAVELGARLQTGGVIIHQLVGAAVYDIALREAEQIAPLLSARGAHDAGARLDRILAAAPTMREILDEERRFALAYLRQLVRGLPPTATPKGEADEMDPQPEVPPQQQAREWLTKTLHPKRRSYQIIDATYRKAMAESEKPWSAREELKATTDPFARDIVPMLQSTAQHSVAALARVQLVRLQLALRERQAATGAFPETLADLSPGAIRSVPLDPFTGKSFRYRRQGASYLLYSVGQNEADDGGEPPAPGKYGEGDLVAGRLYPKPVRTRR